MISVLDDGVGGVISALEKLGMRDNTLVVFHSDNGGVKNSMFSGDNTVDGGLPASNGPFREGKGTLYEGGTRVAALANWPGKIKPGVGRRHDPRRGHVPYPGGLAGAEFDKGSKPLDGMDTWETIRAGKASPRNRTRVQQQIRRQARVRQDDWKLIWKATLAEDGRVVQHRGRRVRNDRSSASQPDEVGDLAGQNHRTGRVRWRRRRSLMEAARLTFPRAAGDRRPVRSLRHWGIDGVGAVTPVELSAPAIIYVNS